MCDNWASKLTWGGRDIYRKLDEWHCPELGELQFRGLNISENWNSNSQHIILPLTVILILLAIIFARFIFNDWGTAWNVGGFLVSLVTLLWMWANHFISRWMQIGHNQGYSYLIGSYKMMKAFGVKAAFPTICSPADLISWNVCHLNWYLCSWFSIYSPSMSS